MAKVSLLTVAFLIYSVYAVNDASSGQDDSVMTVEAMEQVFFRSEKVHAESMAAITKSMSPTSAWQVLKKDNLTTPALIQVTGGVFDKQSNLRKQSPPKGYAGLAGARKLLNDMIFEAMSKYDAEIAKCTEYYSMQCAGMEACRGQIAASNFIAANSRSLIVDAQARINRCEVDIPTRKLELKQHNLKCSRELKKMNSRLAIILGDIEVMTVILKMTDCSKTFVQKKTMSFMHCTNLCTKESFVEFQDEELKKQISRLKASASLKLVKDTFADLVDGVESLESMEFLQFDAKVSPIINKTKFNNPPLPRVEMPSNPCHDPQAGGPGGSKRSNKCVLPPTSCRKLQERFLLIQAGIKDDRDALLEDIADMEKHCKETSDTLQTQISNAQDDLEQAQVDLAGATQKEASAAERARQTAAEHEQLDGDLRKQMKTCTDHYVALESEMCALKKIRGELMKMKGDGHSGFFQDCEVSKWDPEECTKKCFQVGRSVGEQKLTRSVLTHPDGGAKCLPLTAMKKCNLFPCPVDCRLAAWSGWSKCSAECGGGVTQRLREVKRAMKYGGKPCGGTSQSVPCNAQSCEKDCELTEWTKWSWCSKDCDGGTRKRLKFVKHPAEGAGKCASSWSPERLQYRACNMHRCVAGRQCKQKLDVVLLIDGSGSLGQTGWDAEIKAAEMFVDAFAGSGAQARMAVILYSGPFYWSGVRKCTGRNAAKVDMETVCKIKKVTHFTNDMAKVKKLISELTWPRGSTLTSLALQTAKSELSLGRKDAKSVVVTITDGRPLSYRNTWIASWNLRKAARLVWVPVTRYAPLRYIKFWATRRWQENVVRVASFKDLETQEPVDHIVANICPDKFPKDRFGRLM